MSLERELHPFIDACGLTQVSLIAPLTQGLSNRNYYLRGLHPSKKIPGEWVLRVNSWASSQLCHRQWEVSNWQLACRQSLAPELTFVSADFSFYLSEFIAQNEDSHWGELLDAHSAHPLRTEVSHWPRAERLLLTLLKGLSQLPVPGNEMSMRAQWLAYRDRLDEMAAQATDLASDGAHRCLLRRWRVQHRALLAMEPKVEHWLSGLDACLVTHQYSHRDLNPHNILLRDGQLQCIDFEYACSSHPLCDLAAVISTHALSSEQRKWLITQYLSQHPNLTSNAGQAVPAAVDLYWVFACCWALLMAFDSLGAHRDASGGERVQNPNIDETKALEYLNCFDQFRQLITSYLD